jgi:hypothetical protein
LPKGDTSVGTILNDAQLPDPPIARVAAVSFDKVDWVKGCDVASPTGEKRSFRMPWNLIAWQLLGQQGLDILARDEAKSDFDTPPADTLWAQILSEVEASGCGALILIDEFLMWAHDAASPDSTGQKQDRGPVWYDRFKNFFQRLSQATESSSRSCLVALYLGAKLARRIERKYGAGRAAKQESRRPPEASIRASMSSTSRSTAYGCVSVLLPLPVPPKYSASSVMIEVDQVLPR